jgi:hypothetical protein
MRVSSRSAVIVAGAAALVLGGGGAAAFAASSPTLVPASSSPSGVEASEPAGPDSDNVELREGEQSGPDTPGEDAAGRPIPANSLTASRNGGRDPLVGSRRSIVAASI